MVLMLCLQSLLTSASELWMSLTSSRALCSWVSPVRTPSSWDWMAACRTSGDRQYSLLLKLVLLITHDIISIINNNHHHMGKSETLDEVHAMLKVLNAAFKSGNREAHPDHHRLQGCSLRTTRTSSTNSMSTLVGLKHSTTVLRGNLHLIQMNRT